MVDTIRAAAQQNVQLQSTQNQVGSVQKRIESERSEYVEKREDKQARLSPAGTPDSTKPTTSTRDSGATSEDLRQRARELIEKATSAGTNAGSSSLRRGSVLDITA